MIAGQIVFMFSYSNHAIYYIRYMVSLFSTVSKICSALTIKCHIPDTEKTKRHDTVRRYSKLAKRAMEHSTWSLAFLQVASENFHSTTHDTWKTTLGHRKKTTRGHPKCWICKTRADSLSCLMSRRDRSDKTILNKNSPRGVWMEKAQVPPSSERSAGYHHDVLPRFRTKRWNVGVVHRISPSKLASCAS